MNGFRSFLIIFLFINTTISLAFDTIIFERKSSHSDDVVSYFLKFSKDKKKCEISIINLGNNKSVKKESTFVCNYIQSQIILAKIINNPISKINFQVSLETIIFKYKKDNIQFEIDIPYMQKLAKDLKKYKVLVEMYSYLNDVYLMDDPEIAKTLFSP